MIFRGIVHSMDSSEGIFYISIKFSLKGEVKKKMTAAPANFKSWCMKNEIIVFLVTSDQINVLFLHDGTHVHVQLQDDIFRVITASNHSSILQPVTKQVSVCDRVCLENIRTAQSIDQPLLRAYETRMRKLVHSSVLISTLATPV